MSALFGEVHAPTPSTAYTVTVNGRKIFFFKFARNSGTLPTLPTAMLRHHCTAAVQLGGELRRRHDRDMIRLNIGDLSALCETLASHPRSSSAQRRAYIQPQCVCAVSPMRSCVFHPYDSAPRFPVPRFQYPRSKRHHRKQASKVIWQTAASLRHTVIASTVALTQQI